MCWPSGPRRHGDPSRAGLLIVSYLESRELPSATPFTSLRADTYVHSGGVCLPAERAGGWVASRLLGSEARWHAMGRVLYPPYARLERQRGGDRPLGLAAKTR